MQSSIWFPGAPRPGRGLLAGFVRSVRLARSSRFAGSVRFAGFVRLIKLVRLAGRGLAAALALGLALGVGAQVAVDANTATTAELDAITGIGPALAARIVEERRQTPFRSLADLQSRVRGVGEANLRKMRDSGLIVGLVRGAGGAETIVGGARTAPSAAAAPAGGLLRELR